MRLNTTLTFLDIGGNGLGEGGGRALAETVRLNTTITLFNIGENGLGEGGVRALGEALRLNTALATVKIYWNRLGLGQAPPLSACPTCDVSLCWSVNIMRVAASGGCMMRIDL